ncbi:MAG: hypothetical protein SFV23_03030 [Planctomycetaceae bacterium]|nr:hypothetical protein [Planctomycetaceae bacterium]
MRPRLWAVAAIRYLLVTSSKPRSQLRRDLLAGWLGRRTNIGNPCGSELGEQGAEIPRHGPSPEELATFFVLNARRRDSVVTV